MFKGKVLIGLLENEKSYKAIDLIMKLKDLGYEAKIYKTNISENFMPPCYLEDMLFKDGQLFDLGIIGPFDDRENKSIGPDLENDLQDVDSLYNSLKLYLKEDSILSFENFDFVDSLAKKIDLEFRAESLMNYSFLFTIGSFTQHLINNHYIGVYDRNSFVEKIIQYIIKEGGIVSIIASENYRGKLDYIEDIVYVKNIDEINIVLDSRIFKYDIIVDTIRIPRFGIKNYEKFRIEYQRYFAEFEEKYLPFTKNDIYSKNQLIVSMQNGFIDNKESIYYLFDNSRVDAVILNEFTDNKFNFNPYVKLINKDKSVDIILHKEDKVFIKELIELLIKKLEIQDIEGALN